MIDMKKLENRLEGVEIGDLLLLQIFNGEYIAGFVSKMDGDSVDLTQRGASSSYISFLFDRPSTIPFNTPERHSRSMGEKFVVKYAVVIPIEDLAKQA